MLEVCIISEFQMVTFYLEKHRRILCKYVIENGHEEHTKQQFKDNICRT
jgi:hypothetical protein